MIAPNSSIVFKGPFLAKKGTLDIEFPIDIASRIGLYLWTVEYEGGYLVNYVGKTRQRFSTRLRQHKKWYESGKDVCDPDLMAKGENWLLDNPTIEQTTQLYGCYRIFLAPLDVDDATLLRLEMAIIQKLLNAGDKCKDFLGNKQKTARETVGQKIRVQTPALIHGLGDELII